METLAFLTPDQVRQVQRDFGTPVYVYDQKTLEARAKDVLGLPNAFGLTARYAMKALPTAAIVKLLSDLGLHIDASSGYEVERALRAGVPAEKIQLTAQEVPRDLKSTLSKGIRFNACSLHQLDTYGTLFPNTEVSVRINPGLGSGHSNRTNVGGPSSSFGIWRGHVHGVESIAEKHGLKVTGMHTHIGSGTDPQVFLHCAKLSLEIASILKDVKTLSVGGGYKVGRMMGENSADMPEIGQRVKSAFEGFARDRGRQLHLEVEPGTYLVAEAGCLVAEAIDIVNTGPTGHAFLKVNTGMTEILRPSLYGAQHPIVVVPKSDTVRDIAHYLVVGHCCESGDILTPEPGNPEGLQMRTLQAAQVGDAVVIEGAGAYCSGMSAKNYNSFPEAAEVLLTASGEFKLIRKRQTLDQILANEIF
ncbi:MAG: diaminopimelate decarboxylase [Candidatus Hydrogenedentes bacterium]|nr:diaminopimelate decarboxylase [Candidatus Hydrogenedentota bacterium]